MPAPGPAGRVHLPPRTRGIDRAYVGLGIGVYDVLGAGKGVPSHHKHMSKRKTLESFPGGKRGHIHGAIKFYEGQLDDARHTMMIARTAAAYGAHVATSARVVGLLRDGERVVGARVKDLESGNEIDVRAKRTVNATGVWTDEIQKMVGGKGSFRVTASKGVHVVIPRDRIKSKTGLITETEKSLLFIIPCPWSDDFWVIGTTDTPWDLDLAHPAASETDIDYILEHANALLAKPLTRDDVVGVYAGLRPLLAGESDQTSKLSREHAVVSPVPGLVIVAGGKYTTYRVMAKDAVDEALKDCPATVEKSITDKVPLIGAEGYQPLWNNRANLAAQAGLDLPTDRAPAGPLRQRHIRASRADRGGTRTGATPVQRAEVPQGGGQVRRLARGRAAPGRHPGPPDQDLDRHLGPRRRRGPGGRRIGRAAARLGRGGDHRRGRALPRTGGSRARVAAAARRPDRRRRPAGCARRQGGCRLR